MLEFLASFCCVGFRYEAGKEGLRQLEAVAKGTGRDCHCIHRNADHNSHMESSGSTPKCLPQSVTRPYSRLSAVSRVGTELGPLYVSIC